MISSQLKVGFLIIAGVIGMAIVILTLGDVSLKRGYEFGILFDDILDLPPRSIVKISGVEVGRISDVKLYKGRAKVKVWVESDVKIHRDTKPRILKMGLIGTTYLSLTMGTTEYPLIKDGDIVDGIDPLSYGEVMDRLVRGINEVSELIKGIGAEKDVAEDIKQTISSLRKVSDSLNYAFGERGEKLNEVVEDISLILSNLNSIFPEDRAAVGRSIENISSATEDLKIILARIREGEGLAGRLLTSKETGEKLEETIDNIHHTSLSLNRAVSRLGGFSTSLNAEVYYDPADRLFRSYSGVNLMASDRFLRIAVENIMPENEDIGGDRANALTLKAGKKLGHFTVFGGLIRSSGGVGAGWSWEDRIILESELFEFTRTRPWLNFTSKLRLWDFLIFGVGYENILEPEKGGLRGGLEIEIK